MKNIKFDELAIEILNNLGDLVVILDSKTKEYLYYNIATEELLSRIKIDFVDLIYKNSCVLDNMIYDIKTIEKDGNIILVLTPKVEGYSDNETGLLNINGFYLKFEQIYSYFVRAKKNLVVAVLEIDNMYNLLKNLNYSDFLFVTKKVGNIIFSSVRTNIDIVGRFYQDIFVLCLVDLSKENTLKVINRIKNNIYKYSVNELNLILTVSSISKVLKPWTQKSSDIFEEFNNILNSMLQILASEKKISIGFNKILD